MSLIIFDNRTCKYDSFDQEASTASYLTNSAEWIIKFALMSRGCIHSVGGSCHLAVAKNINSASLSELDLTQPNVKKLMTNVVTSECSPLVLSQGTYGFIRDAISKFYKALKNSKLPHSLRILIITTDVHLFHLANAEVYKEIGLFDQLIGAAPHGNISVHLMCSMVTEVTTACASTTYRERALHTASVAFESLGPYFTFSVFPNSPIYFSIELTNWFSSVLNPVLVTILLPACGSVKASVSVLLKGIDTRSNEWLYSFPDMRTLAVQCKVGRGSIDPLHLKGINFVVTAPVNAGSTVPLHQIDDNLNVYVATAHALASSDSILILSGLSNKTGCINTFALVPKESTNNIATHMVLLLLADRDSTLIQSPYVNDEVFVTEENDEIEEFLRACIEKCPKESLYNPLTHPNNLLDFHMRQVCANSFPRTQAKPNTSAEVSQPKFKNAVNSTEAMKTKLTAPTESVVVQHNSLDNYSSLKRETVCINIMSHNKSNSKQKNFVSEDRTDDLPRTFAKEESITNKKTVYAEYRTNCMDVIESYEDEDDTKIGGGKKKNNR